MPTTTTTTGTASDLRQGDTLIQSTAGKHGTGEQVVKVTPKVKNVEVKLEGPTSIRLILLAKDSLVTIERQVPTQDEKVAAVSSALASRFAMLIADGRKAEELTEAAFIARIQKSGLIEAIRWDGEGALKTAHTARYLARLADLLSEAEVLGLDEQVAMFNRFVKQVENDLRSWSLPRSTSVMSNHSDEARYEAMRDLLDRGQIAWTQHLIGERAALLAEQA